MEKIKMTILMLLPDGIVVWIRRKLWRRRNRHNQTLMSNRFDFSVVSVGNNSYGCLNVLSFATKNHLQIGNYVSIAPNVWFLLDVEHSINHISTYPFKVKMLGIEKTEAFSRGGGIVVEDDVWIGFGATILSGVHIGQGAVVAAGALVTKDVPPYAIVGGVPAKLIKYRFEQELVRELVDIDYSRLDKQDVREHLDELYSELREKDQLGWLPKRQMG